MKLKSCIKLALLGGILLFSTKDVYAAQTEQVIPNGVYAGDIDLSGMTEEEATTAINEYIDTLKKKKVTFTTDTNKDKVTLKKLGITWKNKELASDAVELGYHGNLISRFKEISDIKKDKKVYDIETSIDETKLENYVKKTIQAYDKKPVEPKITRTNGKFKITKEKNGVTVNVDETIKSVQTALGEGWDGEDVKVETVCEIAKPEHTSESLKVIKDELGTCTTTYSSGQRGRTQSLELSTKRLDGTVIYPGETVSVSELMGPRTKEGGYGTAIGYYGNSTTDTIGAGICQTASTLYDAALYAELGIAERHNHSMIVHYVKYSMDSTIYAGSDYKNPSKDLKLKNESDYPVYIDSYASGGRCRFTIYGKETRPKNREVKYISKTLAEKWPTQITYINDSSKLVGYTSVQQGAFPYVKSTLTKVVYIDGKETERTVINTDKYNSSNKKVIRGTKQPETTAAPTTKASETKKPGTETTKAGTTTKAETKAPETTKAPATTKAPQTKAETKKASGGE